MASISNFILTLKGLVEKINPELLQVKTEFEKYLALYTHEDELLEKIRKSSITQQIADANTTRDITFRGLVDAVQSAQKHFKAEVREAARKVKILLNTYGNFTQLSYQEETAKIYNLVQELQTTHFQDITTLNLLDWVEELDKNNKDFEALMNQRYDQQIKDALFFCEESEIK